MLTAVWLAPRVSKGWCNKCRNPALQSYVGLLSSLAALESTVHNVSLASCPLQITQVCTAQCLVLYGYLVLGACLLLQPPPFNALSCLPRSPRHLRPWATAPPRRGCTCTSGRRRVSGPRCAMRSASVWCAATTVCARGPRTAPTLGWRQWARRTSRVQRARCARMPPASVVIKGDSGRSRPLRERRGRGEAEGPRGRAGRLGGREGSRGLWCAGVERL